LVRAQPRCRTLAARASRTRRSLGRPAQARRSSTRCSLAARTRCSASETCARLAAPAAAPSSSPRAAAAEPSPASPTASSATARLTSSTTARTAARPPAHTHTPLPHAHRALHSDCHLRLHLRCPATRMSTAACCTPSGRRPSACSSGSLARGAPPPRRDPAEIWPRSGRDVAVARRMARRRATLTLVVPWAQVWPSFEPWRDVVCARR